MPTQFSRKHLFISFRTLATIVVSLLLLTAISWRDKHPRIFLMGDSISIHYGPYLIKDVAPFADIDQKAIETINGREFSRNGGDSKRVLSYITAKLSVPGFVPDYIILNCGLHDVGHDSITDQLQVSQKEYRDNLNKIFSLIQQKKIGIIWVTTTPVVDSIHNSRTKHLTRYSKDLEEYNAIAAEVCKQHKVSVINLHDFTITLGTQAYLDNVHYKEEYRPLQAAYITGELRQILQQKKTAP